MDLRERKGASSTRHPWEVARAEFFLRLLERHELLASGRDWLDAGAGDAWFACKLRSRLPEASITCWDVNYSADDIEALGALDPSVSYTADRPVRRFDRILLLDVIEHVEDDEGFLSATVRDLLRGEGVVLVSVPAHPSLSSSHDRALRHKRRYTPAGCRGLLERAGLTVIMGGGLFFSLLPARFAQIIVERALSVTLPASRVGSWSGGQVTTKALTRMLTVDGRLSLAFGERGVSMPGLSYWALCQPSRA